jgi:hypothetical protein
VPTKRIVNASPLILLTKIGRIDLLTAEYVEVVVPMAVIQEVTRLDSNDPVVLAVNNAGWSVVERQGPVPSPWVDGSLSQGRSLLSPSLLRALTAKS